MRISSLPFTAAAAVLLATAAASAQITVTDTGSCAANPFVSTTGNPGTVAPGAAITVDTNPANVMVGAGSAARTAVAANASYLPTGQALSPVTGWTVQWWAKPGSPTLFAYYFGDASMLHPTNGALRCFANGTVSTNANIVVRGLPSDTYTGTGAGAVLGPLATGGQGGGTNAQGFVHLAVKFDPVTQTSKWLINGTTSSLLFGQAGATNVGSNLKVIGYDGTTTAGPPGNWDDIRVYNFARTDADILADMNMTAIGNGPSGMSNVPCHYYEVEGAVQPHQMYLGTSPVTALTPDPTATGTRIFTDTTVLEWGSNSPTLPGTPASHLINIFGPSTGFPALDARNLQYRPAPAPPVAFATPGVPGVQLGHGYSVPANPGAIAWADGMGLGTIPGLVIFSLISNYTYQTSPNNLLPVPPGLFQDGDAIYFQGIALDAAYPATIATTNLAVAAYKAPVAGPHAHIEAGGPGAIQVTGFWEIWNTGDTDITSVTIDATTCVANGGTAQGFVPTGALNSGGTLSAGTSYRFNSEVYTGLSGLPIGFTGVTPYTTAAALAGVRGLTFNFSSNSAMIDHLIFDCESDPANVNGAAYRGATVTVTFANTAVLMGTLAPDPTDPLKMIINL